MESVTGCRQRIEALRCELAEQSGALAALKEVFAQEAEHLRRHDQARRLRDLRSEVMREVEHIRRVEVDAAYTFNKVMLISGLAKLAFGALGAAVVGTREHPLSVGAQLAKGDFERTQPYGTVLVAIGPGGVPDDVHVIPVSRWARESDRSEAEIEAALKAKGYRLMTPQSFSTVMEELEDRVSEGLWPCQWLLPALSGNQPMGVLNDSFRAGRDGRLGARQRNGMALRWRSSSSGERQGD